MAAAWRLAHHAAVPSALAALAAAPRAHRDPASRFSIPPQKSAAAAAAGRVLLQTTNLWFGVPAKPAQPVCDTPMSSTGLRCDTPNGCVTNRSRQQKIPVGSTRLLATCSRL
eukprot:COSAG01_NODE_2002_length_8672_cov_53.309227_3_plen_112_part_00